MPRPASFEEFVAEDLDYQTHYTRQAINIPLLTLHL